MGPDLPDHESAIRNDAWMVIHYGPGRTPEMRLRRQQAIRKLGLTVRHAFNNSDNFEPLLAAILDGLHPKEDRPPF